MKLTLERSALLAALGIVKPAAGKPTLPILSHVAISTFEKSVEFICSNLDLTLRTKCDAEIGKKGDTTVRVALLHSLVASFTGDHVELELIKKVLHVRCGQSKYELGTLDTEEFPPPGKPKDGDEFTLPQPVLRAMLNATSFCASTDESRYVLRSSFLKLNGDVTTVSTDGRRLAEISHDADDLPKKEREVLIPTQAVGELLRLLSDDEEKAERVRVTMSDQMAEFKLGDTVLTTKLIEGNYPNYKQVIPSTRGVKPVTISRPEFLEILKRVALIDEVCELRFNKQSLTILATNNKDTIGNAHESLMTSPVEKPVRIKFAVKYLVDALGVLDDEEVLFFGEASNAPGVLRTPNGSKHNKGWTYVVMPRSMEEAETKAAEKEAKAAEAQAAEEQQTAEVEA